MENKHGQNGRSSARPSRFSRGHARPFSAGGSTGFSRGFHGKPRIGGASGVASTSTFGSSAPKRTFGSYAGSGRAGFRGSPSAGFRAGAGSGASRGGFRGGSRGSRGGFNNAQRIDISKFINKAVVTEETGVYVPEHSFDSFALHEHLKRNIILKGYKNPTPIQDRTIPYILKGKDVVGIANTGTGKTAAFLIPLINKVVANLNEQVLIVVPTRELALQIEDELHGFIKGMRMYSICCVGGSPIGRQMRALRLHNNFVIGTPGRLKDLMERGVLSLAPFKSVVLDEADRMLDMGFVHDMRYMLTRMDKNRHTLFFSATVSREIDGLIKEFLHEPITVSVKTQDTSKHVEQDIIRVTQGRSKIDVLHDLLIKPEFSRVLIFGRTKHGVERLTNVLIERGFKAESIHGDKVQARRQKALLQFKEGKAQILVATDVAARGLDIDGVSHVINFDIPATYDDYIHRIGRTGRAGKRGKALTFID